MDIALSTSELTKTYGSGAKAVHALQGVSLNIAAGEIFSLLGPNGAGKTTFIKCVLGVAFTSGGSGSVLGYPLASVKSKEHIGYLPENHRYPLHLTGAQVLYYFGKLSGLRQSVLDQRVEQTLATVGMTEWRNTKVRKYSKGMMQRLGLAQALINDPQLILLDEPTDGVDPVGRKEIRDILVHLKNEGKTVFLNSHLLSEVERISDRVVIMDHGKIIRDGSVNELTRTANIYRLQLQNLDNRDGYPFTLSAAEEGWFEVSCTNTAELNAMIDALRSHDVLIESVLPKRSTLEDLFINLIQSSDITRQ